MKRKLGRRQKSAEPVDGANCSQTVNWHDFLGCCPFMRRLADKPDKEFGKMRGGFVCPAARRDSAAVARRLQLHPPPGRRRAFLFPKDRLTLQAAQLIVISSFGEMTKYMRDFMAITKALSDPNRVRILLALRRRELCVCQITELFGLAPSTVSKHLSLLHHASLIQSRKSERWVYYRLPDESAPVAVREALDWVGKSLAGTEEAAADAMRLKNILRTDLAVICHRQKC